MIRPRYLLQRNEPWCCDLFALVNALRFYGFETPKPGTKEWRSLVRRIGCEHGTAVSTERTAHYLGLFMYKIQFRQVPTHVPALVVFKNPEVGCSLHSALVVDTDKDGWELVNYRCSGPVVERVDRSVLTIPSHFTVESRAWALEMQPCA